MVTGEGVSMNQHRQDIMRRVSERNMKLRIEKMKRQQQKAVREYQRLAIACLASLIVGMAFMSCRSNFKVLRPEKPTTIEIKQS